MLAWRVGGGMQGAGHKVHCSGIHDCGVDGLDRFMCNA